MILALIFFWLLCGIIAAMIGSQKGEGCFAFIMGVLFGPFGILFALVSNGNRKVCPSCKELIHKDAMVCPHCQRDMNPYPNWASEESKKQRLRWLWQLIMLLILILSAAIAYGLSDYYTPYLPQAVKTFLQPSQEPP